MGSFSFTKADNLTQISNIVYDKSFKFLIPEKFGGGYIKEHYQDYGNVGVSEDFHYEALFDVHELLAFWNPDFVLADGTKIREHLQFDGEYPLMKKQDKYTDKNRKYGIELFFSKGYSTVEYPLKFVSPSFKGTYEECSGRSFDDNAQGFYPVYRKGK